MAILIYSDEIGLRNSTQLGVVWIPAFAGMTTTRFFANHFVRSIAIVAAKITARRNSFSECLLLCRIGGGSYPQVENFFPLASCRHFRCSLLPNCRNLP